MHCIKIDIEVRMSKKGKKKKVQTIKEECRFISEERLTEIYTESFYRALKRLDEEKENVQERSPNQKKGRIWCTNALLALNLLFFPFKINKHFKLNKSLYDGILVVTISAGLECFGALVWAAGMYKLISDFSDIFDKGMSTMLLASLPIDLVFSFFGSFFYLAGKSFGEEKDSNKVYAYSASILALVSCIVSLVALLKQ